MKNVERLNEYIKKEGPDSILIHSIPNSQNWLVCQKTAENLWTLILMNPMNTTLFYLGECNDAQHIEIWTRLTKIEIGNKISQIVLAERLKTKVKLFIKQYNKFNKRK